MGDFIYTVSLSLGIENEAFTEIIKSMYIRVALGPTQGVVVMEEGGGVRATQGWGASTGRSLASRSCKRYKKSERETRMDGMLPDVKSK